MPNLAIRKAVCIVLALFLLSPYAVWAIEENAPFEDFLLRWNNTLESGEKAVSQPGIDGKLLRSLLDNIKVIKESVLVVRTGADRELVKRQNLLNSLGPVPAQDAPPESVEIIEKRATFSEQVTHFDTRVKQCNVALARVNALQEEISNIEKNRLAQALYEPTPFPLAPGLIASAFSQIPTQFGQLNLGVSNWAIQNKQNSHRNLGLVALSILFAGGAALAMLLSRWIHRRYGWKSQVAEPTSNQKFLASLSECLGSVVVPILFIIIFFWSASKFLGLEISENSRLMILIFASMDFVIIVGVSRASLAPNFPQFRISNFTDQTAKKLSHSIYLLGIVGLVLEIIMVLGIARSSSSLDVLRIGAISAPEELASLVAMVYLITMAMLLLNVLRDANWRFNGMDSDPDSERSLSPMYRIIFNIARIILVISVILGLIGYLNFGMFVMIRIVWMLGIIAIARLAHGFTSALLTETTSTDNRFGSWVNNLVGLTESSHSRDVFWASLIFDVVLFSILIPIALIIFGVPWEEIRLGFANLMNGIEVGNRTFSLIDIGSALGIFVALLVGIRLFQGFLSNRILVQTNFDVGVRDAVSSVIGYIGIGIIILFTLSLLGLSLRELALIFGALSVGIGFGLQHVFNNFLSGLVLLIQRPIKSGDWIVVGDKEGYVKRVNVITTEIQTFDNATLIVPNGDLVSSQVINWMHKSRLGRVIIPVGVAYDSDPEQVSELLLKCATDNPDVLSRPAPNVLFKDFGENALLFELRFFIRDMDDYWRASSSARFEIKKVFDTAGIVIPFPQRVVNVTKNR